MIIHKIKKTKSYFLIVILMALAVAPAFVLGEGNRNLLLIVVMGISPLILIYYNKFFKNEIVLLLFVATIILFPILLHPESMRWSTVMYSIMFCLTFMAYQRLLRHKRFTINNYQKLLKYLIYAYAVTLLIQQFCVLTGLPIFNISNYNPMEPWKLNSLAAEPSHSARIVALLMYCFITIKELVTGGNYNFRKEVKKDKWVWLAFIWTMITMGSGTAFLLIPIVLLKFIRFRNLIPLFVIVIFMFFLVQNFGINSFNRTYSVFLSTLTLDQDAIIEADHSASVRIIPMIITSKMIDISTLDGWFGHGVDYVSTFLSDLMPGVPEGISGGGLFQVWLEYGFLSFILFVLFSFTSTYGKGDFLSILFWIMLVFLYGVNNQIVWLCIVLLFTNNYFLKTRKVKIKIHNDNT